MVPPKDSPKWRVLVEKNEVPFQNLATRMMFKRCQMLIKLNPGNREKIEEAALIAHEFFTSNKDLVKTDLELIARGL